MSRPSLILIALSIPLALGGWWWLTRDTTIYAPAYSERQFAQVEIGMDLEQVYSLLGEPLAVRDALRPEMWCYHSPAIAQTGSYGSELTVFGLFERSSCIKFDSHRRVSGVLGKKLENISVGMTQPEVAEILGGPVTTHPASVKTLHYSRPGGENLFRARIVKIDAKNRVSDIVTYKFYD